MVKVNYVVVNNSTLYHILIYNKGKLLLGIPLLYPDIQPFQKVSATGLISSDQAGKVRF